MNKTHKIWEDAKAAAIAHPGKPSLVICLDGTFTLTWTDRAPLKGTDHSALPSSPAEKETAK